MIKSKVDILFESSWEVCNKVGGIYTVVKSKAALMKKNYKDYFMVGPYFEEKAKIELNQKEPPQEIKKAFDAVKKQGINCFFGTWNTDGQPNAILIDFKGLVSKKDKIKESLWKDYGIDSFGSQWEFDEPIIWSTAVGMLLDEISKNYENKKISSHFHEWMAGAALLYLKKQKSKIATVFTTHATMLGRTIAGSGRPLYEVLDSINPEEEAYKSGIQSKFHTERACAKNAEIFTTVSEITALEAEKILGRKPEVLVLNGLDMSAFPSLEETTIRHASSRDKIREYITSHFFPYYTFEIKHTLIFFILGRNEFRNKGVDIFIEALSRLNESLKKEKSHRTVVAFFWIPMGTNGIKTEVLENKNYYKHIKDYVDYISDDILSNIVYELVRNQKITENKILRKDFQQSFKKNIMRFKREGNPPICTHNIDEGNNEIMRSLINHGLDNKEDDKVKTLLYPVYLDGSDGLTNLPYYDCMAGCHLGAFPSYYEPWGYTPLEAGALGVPSITTDMAGFGRFMKPYLKENMDEGLFVLDRLGQDENKVIEKFADLLYKFSKRNKDKRAKNKIRAIELSKLADWKKLIENYINAHNQAIEKLKS